MSEITIFALALLAVPVFARFAKVPPPARKTYHLIGLGGLLLIVGEATRLTATKITILSAVVPVMDFLTAGLAFLSVIAGAAWVTVYYLLHMREA